MSSSDDAGRCSWYSCLDGHTGSGLEHHDRRSRTRSVVGDWQRKRSKRSIARWVTTVGDRLLCSRLLSVCCILPYARTIELRPVLTISACPYIILQSVWLCMTLAAYSFVAAVGASVSTPTPMALFRTSPFHLFGYGPGEKLLRRRTP